MSYAYGLDISFLLTFEVFLLGDLPYKIDPQDTHHWLLQRNEEKIREYLQNYSSNKTYDMNDMELPDQIIAG